MHKFNSQLNIAVPIVTIAIEILVVKLEVDLVVNTSLCTHTHTHTLTLIVHFLRNQAFAGLWPMCDSLKIDHKYMYVHSARTVMKYALN